MIACKLKRYHALERYSQQNYVSNIIRTIISRSFYLKWRYKLLTDRAKKKFVESKHLSLNVSFSKSNNCSKYSLGQCRAEWKGKFGVSRGLSGFSNPPRQRWQIHFSLVDYRRKRKHRRRNALTRAWGGVTRWDDPGVRVGWKSPSPLITSDSRSEREPRALIR